MKNGDSEVLLYMETPLHVFTPSIKYVIESCESVNILDPHKRVFAFYESYNIIRSPLAIFIIYDTSSNLNLFFYSTLLDVDIMIVLVQQLIVLLVRI